MKMLSIDISRHPLFNGARVDQGTRSIEAVGFKFQNTWIPEHYVLGAWCTTVGLVHCDLPLEARRCVLTSSCNTDASIFM